MRQRVITKIRQMGQFLGQILMPNLSIFLTWGVFSFLLPFTSGHLHQQLVELDQLMMYLLLPILLGYTGARAVYKRAGVVGAMGAAGVIVSASVPQVFAALIIGPFAGFALQQFDKKWLKRVKPGYEMLVHNLSAGFFGVVISLLGIMFIGPLAQQMVSLEEWFIARLATSNWIVGVHLILEPLKVLFLNNTVNHGILTPLGIEAASQVGTSVLFLLETNPGPGLGVLAAFLFFGPKVIRKQASSGLFVQGLGGLHEIYFPFVWLSPKLFLSLIAGGMSGTLVFQWTQVGLKAPVSPGSLLMIALNTPAEMWWGVFSGILVSFLVSFFSASFILQQKINLEEQEQEVIQISRVKQIIFACEAGMGSSAMGASLLKRQFQSKNLEISISYQPLNQVLDNYETLLIVQEELSVQARKQAPNAQIYVLQQFLDETIYEQLMMQWEKPNIVVEKNSMDINPQEKFPYKKIVLLYQGNRRGSQTIVSDYLKKSLKQQGISCEVLKMPLEKYEYEMQTLVVYHVKDRGAVVLPQGVMTIEVTNWTNFEQYEQWLKGEKLDVFVTT